MPTKLSIIICTFNRAASLRRTLSSVVRQDAPAAQWEVVVVDNNCTDNTQQVFEEFAESGHSDEQRSCDMGTSTRNFIKCGNETLTSRLTPLLRMTSEEFAGSTNPVLRLVIEPNQGLSHARNRGIAEARGEILAIIDDDVELSAGFVSAWLDFFAQHPNVGAAGGRIEPMWEGMPPRWMSSWTARPIAGVVDFGTAPREFPAGKYPIGANMAFRKEVLVSCGIMCRAFSETRSTPPPNATDDIHHAHGQSTAPSAGGVPAIFNPALGRIGKKLLAGEEKDLFARLKTCGVKIYYCPDASLHHIIPRERLTISYLSRVSRMFGVSERVRVGLWRALMGECVKWGGTLVLSLFYLLSLRPARAWGIIVLRASVTAGII